MTSHLGAPSPGPKGTILGLQREQRAPEKAAPRSARTTDEEAALAHLALAQTTKDRLPALTITSGDLETDSLPGVLFALAKKRRRGASR